MSCVCIVVVLAENDAVIETHYFVRFYEHERKVCVSPVCVCLCMCACIECELFLMLLIASGNFFSGW